MRERKLQETPLPKVVLTHPFHPRVMKEHFQGRVRPVIVRNRRELEREIREAQGLITRFSDRVDAKLLSRAPQLKAVANFAVGFDNIDLQTCARLGIRVTNTPDVLTRATAELTLALLLAAARRLPEGERLTRGGHWKGWAPDQLIGQELRGRTAVLVGRGRIGRETARLFKSVGLRVRWITRRSTQAQIRRGLQQAQILSLHLRLTPETRHWLNRERLALLPGEAIVVNTTRGPVIDEAALIDALTRRKIFAAGLDVYEREPAVPKSLRRLPNVVLLPHLGSATEEARAGMARLACTGLLGILNGKRPSNEVKFRRS